MVTCVEESATSLRANERRDDAGAIPSHGLHETSQFGATGLSPNSRIHASEDLDRHGCGSKSLLRENHNDDPWDGDAGQPHGPARSWTVAYRGAELGRYMHGLIVRDIRFRFRHELHQAERRPGAGSAGDRRQQFRRHALRPQRRTRDHRPASVRLLIRDQEVDSPLDLRLVGRVAGEGKDVKGLAGGVRIACHLGDLPPAAIGLLQSEQLIE